MLPRKRCTASVSSARVVADSCPRASASASSCAAIRFTGPMRSRSATSRSIAADSSPAPATSPPSKPKRSGSKGGGHWNLSPETRPISARRSSSFSARAVAPARASRAAASTS